MKERFSNVIAWVGFSFLVVNVSAVAGDLDLIIKLFLFSSYGEFRFDELVILATVYVGCAVVNYLLVGRFRFLPWVKK